MPSFAFPTGGVVLLLLWATGACAQVRPNVNEPTPSAPSRADAGEPASPAQPLESTTTLRQAERFAVYLESLGVDAPLDALRLRELAREIAEEAQKPRIRNEFSLPGGGPILGRDVGQARVQIGFWADSTLFAPTGGGVGLRFLRISW